MYYFIASDYSATGKGRTVFLLITSAVLKPEHYEVQPEHVNVNGVWTYNDGILKYSHAQIAIESLNKRIDPYFGACSEAFTQEQFFKLYGKMIPENIKDIFQKDNKIKPRLDWFQSLHFNYA